MKKEVIKNKFVGVEYEPFTKSYVDTYVQEKEVIEVAPPVHKKQIFYSDKKAIVSGDVVEIISYEHGNYYGFEGSAKGKAKSDNVKRSDNINLAKKNLRRLINANASGNDLFVTLTYADNFTDLVQAKKDFKRFIKAMKRKGYNLKYVYVIEFQKRGAIHFHVIFFDCGYIDCNLLSSVWKKGFVKINRINDVDNAGAYVVKYMDKNLLDNRLIGHDLYGRSRGLKKPIETNNPQEVRQLLEGLSNNLVYSNTYSNDYKGTCVYCQFNKKRSLNSDKK